MEQAKPLAADAAKPQQPVGELGPKMKALAAMAPEGMAELMAQFIERKNLNERATIRLRMKALLDLFSADTGYPPIPALDGVNRRQQPGAFAGLGVPPRAVPPLRVGGEAEVLQAEVAAAVGEEEAAAAPADVLPAPGAPVASAADPVER